MKKTTYKTLGAQAARLVTELHEQGKTLFSHADVARITGLRPKSVRNFMASLVQRGIATRLKPGLFILVPFELGRTQEFLGSPIVVAGALVGGRDYYVSHASAMDIHQMVTQPQLIVFVTTPRAKRPRTILGTEFRFVRCKPEHLFGVEERWVSKTEKVRVSDLQRTVIDGLKQPEYCGGFTEVAKGFWMRRDDMDIQMLVDYALRLKTGAVICRLGFLLECFEVEAPRELNRLRKNVSTGYVVLDPLLPAEGKHLARWGIRVNVDPTEIEAVVQT